MSRTTHSNRNIAARMGRWSADALEDGDVRLARVRRRRVRARRHGRHEEDRRRRARAGRVRPHGQDPRRGLPAARRRDRPDPELDAAGERPAVHSSRRDVVAAISSSTASRTSARRSLRRTRARSHTTGTLRSSSFEIRGDPDTAVDRIDPVLDAVADAQRAHPQLFIGEFGDASAAKQSTPRSRTTSAKAGLLSIPVTLIILVVAFGALVAAGIPLLLALTAVFATFGLIALPSHVCPVATQAPAVVLLIGLAVGVDYSLFYLKREREERAAGRSEQAALEAAAATSGRSVLVSGLTVIVAMAGHVPDRRRRPSRRSASRRSSSSRSPCSAR